MTLIRLTILASAIGAMSACASESAHVELRSLHQGLHCGDTNAGLRWLAPASLAQVINGPGAGQQLGEPARAAPAVGDDEELLLVSLGQKNTGGFGVALAQQQAEIRDEVVMLPLEIQQPAPDAMTTMQLTNPCLVIALRGADYDLVDGGTLGRVAAPRSAK